MKHMILRECCAFLMLCMLLVFCAAALAEEDAITVTDEAYIEVADVDEVGEEAGEQEFESEEDAFREDEETISATEDTFSEDEETISATEDTFWEDEESFSATEAAASVIDEIENVEIVDDEETIVADSPAMGQVTGASIANATVTLEPDTFTYCGSACEPAVTVTVGNSTLSEGIDYTVAYTSNINAGTATATITGKGNYAGTASQTFTIKKKTVTVSYNGSLDKVYDKTRNLRNVSASSFKFSGVVSGEEIQVLGIEGHYDSADVGTYSNIGLTVKIVYTDKDKTTPAVNLNYELSPNTCTASGKITPKTLTLKPGVPKSSRDSTLVPQTKVYGTIDPPMRAKVGGLMSGDASSSAIGGKLTRESGENVGKYKIQIGTVKGKGNYAEAVTLEEGYFEILPKDIGDVDVGMEAIDHQNYTGSAIEPAITLKYAKRVDGLVRGRDFDAAFVNNVEPGTATVTITGKGNYTGTRTATFRINPSAAPVGTVISAQGNAKTTVTAAPGTVVKLDLGGSTATKFKSSNKKVATVDQNGNIFIKKAGKVKITMKVGKKKRKVTLTVKDPTIPSSIYLNVSGTVVVKKGDTFTLTATLPENTTSGLIWKSSNKKVARVSNGVVTFRKPGKVTITCTCVRGKKKAKVTFRVSK